MTAKTSEVTDQPLSAFDVILIVDFNHDDFLFGHPDLQLIVEDKAELLAEDITREIEKNKMKPVILWAKYFEEYHLLDKAGSLADIQITGDEARMSDNLKYYLRGVCDLKPSLRTIAVVGISTNGEAYHFAQYLQTNIVHLEVALLEEYCFDFNDYRYID